MRRQNLIFLLLSIVVVIFARYIQLLIVDIAKVFTWINSKAAPLFNYLSISLLIRKIILLIIIPLLIAAVPAFIYWVIKGKKMPHFMELTWCIWLIIVLSNVLIH